MGSSSRARKILEGPGKFWDCPLLRSRCAHFHLRRLHWQWSTAMDSPGTGESQSIPPMDGDGVDPSGAITDGPTI